MAEKIDVFNAATGCVRVLSRKCGTCIFRPGNLMHLRPGHVENMRASAVAANTYIPCHDTLPYGRFPGYGAAVCRGFWDVHARDSLYTRLALMIDNLEEVAPPGEENPNDQ